MTEEDPALSFSLDYKDSFEIPEAEMLTCSLLISCCWSLRLGPEIQVAMVTYW